MLSFLLLAASPPDVLRVDPADPLAFASIQLAIDAAEEGDTILIAPGSYSNYVVDGKSVSLVADGGSVSATGGLVQSEIRNLGAEQRVLVHGVEGGPLGVFGNDGEVWIEATSLSGQSVGVGDWGPFLFVANCASVVLVDVTIEPWEALHSAVSLSLLLSTVTAYDCRFVGVDGAETTAAGQDGGLAARLSGATLYASGCTFLGGAGGDGSGTQSTCHFYRFGGSGGHGIVLEAGSVLRARDCEFAGAPAGHPDPCQGVTGSPGEAVVVLDGTTVDLFGVARRARAASPVRAGGTFEVELVGAPFDLAFLLVTEDPTQLAITSPYVGQLFLAPGFGVLAAGSLDAAGTSTVEFPAPPLQGAAARRVTAQPVFVDTTNGLLSLGGPSRVVFVDAAS